MRPAGVLLSATLVLLSLGALAAEDYPQVRPGVALKFPRDHGSHPRFRNEWWYITGWLRTSGGGELGVQITFFRNRPRVAEEISSRFAPRQLLFAHAALADPGAGRLLHDQRAARAGFGLAEGAEGRTDVAIGDWSLKQTDGGYAAEIAARDFRYALRFEAKQPPLLQGERGFSRKGPGPAQASYYYSLPHLSVSGSVVIAGSGREVSGEDRHRLLGRRDARRTRREGARAGLSRADRVLETAQALNACALPIELRPRYLFRKIELPASSEPSFVTVQGRKLEVRTIAGTRRDAPALVFLHEGLGSVSLWRDFPEKAAKPAG